jgi:hypothetical protein
MKISSLRGSLFACILVIITISADAMEGIVDNNDDYLLQNNQNHQVTTQANPADRDSHKVPARSPLDIVFIVSNALLGFLLLRRANNS